MSDNRSIGVFDSGLGGLTVVGELRRVLPNEDIIYFGDTGRVPYGTRSVETIEKYARQDQRFLIGKDVKLIIAACGTVSAVAAHTGDEHNVPFIGVLKPAVRRAAEVTKSEKIGVLGTTATIRSNSYSKAIKEILPQCEVTSCDCPMFVPLVEAGWIERNDMVTIETAKRYLKPMIDAKVDTLILGCTHYPILKDIISDIMGSEVELINTGTQAAEAAEKYLRENDLISDKRQPGDRRFFVSDRIESFSKTASVLLGTNIQADVERVDIDHLGR